MSQQITAEEVKAAIRFEIKVRYRNIKSYAYARGKKPYDVYQALQRNGRLPKWILEDFGLTRKVEVVRTVTYWVEA